MPLYETPVGFKYIGEKLIAGEIVFGGEESAGLTVEGHVPEKDGILADLLVAEMAGATGKTLGELVADLEARDRPVLIDAGSTCRCRPRRREALARAARLPAATVSPAARSLRVNRIDGMKLIFEDGSWILVRESGTEPVARVYVEARSPERIATRSPRRREELSEGMRRT